MQKLEVETEKELSSVLKEVIRLNTEARVIPIGDTYNLKVVFKKVVKSCKIEISPLFFDKKVLLDNEIEFKKCGNGECEISEEMLYEKIELQVKQALVGYGRADKHQIMEMVKKNLKLKTSDFVLSIPQKCEDTKQK